MLEQILNRPFFKPALLVNETNASSQVRCLSASTQLLSFVLRLSPDKSKAVGPDCSSDEAASSTQRAVSSCRFDIFSGLTHPQIELGPRISLKFVAFLDLFICIVNN